MTLSTKFNILFFLAKEIIFLRCQFTLIKQISHSCTCVQIICLPYNTQTKFLTSNLTYGKLNNIRGTF